MNDRTKRALEQLREADWFVSVGNQDTNAAVVVASWDAAIESCSADEWQDLLLEAANRYTEGLAARDLDRFRGWNERVKELRPITMALVAERTNDVVQHNRLPELFVQTVNWDILHLVLEAEFADLCPPGFFSSQAYWYVRGHFPCGWKGSFPDGKLVIY